MERVTLRDVAREANVAPSTVSLHLRNRPGVSEETGARIDAAVEKLGYQSRTNPSNRLLVGLAVEPLRFPVFSDVYYAEVIMGIEERAREMEISVIFSVVEKQALIDVIRKQHAQGWIILGAGAITDSQILEAARLDVPLVLLDNHLSNDHFPCVLPDHVGGGYQACKHLLDLGHRRLAILCGPEKYKTLKDRLLGALAAVSEAGISITELILQPSISSGHPTKGYLEMQAILQSTELPTAVFAISDKTALGALKAIQEAGLRVPEDISVIGFDDIEESRHTSPPLTTIYGPKRELGIVAMQRLADIVHGQRLPPTVTLLPTHLIERESTAEAG